jgi:hypothetical protein
VTPEDARKLIGGYATGNLADEERQALFAAALSEQDLFDALVKEQGLKELLDDPDARQRLLDQLRPASQRNVAWRWAAAGSLALATVMIAVVMMRVPERPSAAPVQMAARLPAPVEPTPPPAVAAPVAPPAPSLRDSVRAMPLEAAPKPQNRIATAPVAALSEQVDAMAKSKETAQRAGGVVGGIVSGLQYRILRRDPDGTFTEASADSLFNAGDAVRVRVEPPAAGILSLSSGNELLASIPVEANQAYDLPVDRPITLEGAAGETRLALALLPRDGARRDTREKKAEALSSGAAGAAAQPRAVLSVEIVLRHR